MPERTAILISCLKEEADQIRQPVTPATLRSVFMDLADQLGQQGFRWVIVVSGHGDPAHNRMLDQASDYFHDTYGGEMVNLFGICGP